MMQFFIFFYDNEIYLLFLLFFQKKPIIQIKAASALNRILVLCDNTISMLNMLDLEVTVIFLLPQYSNVLLIPLSI